LGSDFGVARGDRCVDGGKFRLQPIPLGAETRSASGHVGKSNGQVLALPVEGFIGRLQRRVLLHDRFKLPNSGGLVRRGSAAPGDLLLLGRGPISVSIGLLLRQLELLLVSFQDPALLAIRLEELGHVLTQSRLDAPGLIQLGLVEGGDGLVGGPVTA